MSEVMRRGEAARYLRWLTSPNFRANKGNAKLLEVARTHLKAFDQYTEDCNKAFEQHPEMLC